MTKLMMIVLLSGVTVFAAKKTPPKSEHKVSITEMIDSFATEHNVSIIVDPGVRGNVFIHNTSPSTKEEDFNVLTHSLALNGYTMIKKGNYWVVRSSRNAQRDNIPVYVNKLPPAQPELMVTYIREFEEVSPQKVMNESRILTSKDGEMSVEATGRYLVISDYTSNLHRIEKIFAELDR